MDKRSDYSSASANAAVSTAAVAEPLAPLAIPCRPLGRNVNRGNLLPLVFLVFGSLGSTQNSQANLLSNPSFETGDASGWTLTGLGGPVCLGGSPFFGGASDGVCAVQLNGGNNPPGAVLEQTFATSAGVTYLLTFDIGKFSQSTFPGTSSVLVELFDEGVRLPGFPLSADDSVGGGTHSLPMQPEDFVNFVTTFTATGTSTLLRITDQSTDGGINFDTMLDNFLVTVFPVVLAKIVHSPLDDGLTYSVATLPVDGTPIALNLFLINGDAPSAFGTECDGTGIGEEACGWHALIATTGGAVLTSFAPEGDVIFRLDPTLLRANGGNFELGTLGPHRLGTLMATAESPGSVTVDGYHVVKSRLTSAPLELGTLAQTGTDTDADGVIDTADNCSALPNPDQRDTDGDNIGNHCDQDIAPDVNDCIVNPVDLGALKLAFFGTEESPNWNPDADFNGDGVVNPIDLGLFRNAFFGVPGPSGLPNACGAQP